MGRRTLLAAVAATVGAVLLVLASSAGPLRLWTAPAVTTGPYVAPTPSPSDLAVPPPDMVVEDRKREPESSLFLQILGVVLAVLMLVAAAYAAIGWDGWRLWPGFRSRRSRAITALPEVMARELTVDIAAARAALAEGSPRNAIVACWMQLERDAAAAGLPRGRAETSMEYAARVVAESSVDPAPIGELAALYREARFSHHELDDRHRRQALTALDRVAVALRTRVEATP